MKKLLEKILFWRNKDLPETEYIPPILYRRFYLIVILAPLCFVTGILCAIIGIGSTWYFPIIFFTGVALAILFVALYYLYNIKHKGYYVIEGTITYIKETSAVRNIGRSSRPILYHVTDDDGITYHIPVHKGNAELPLNSRIRVYAPINVSIVELSGIYRLSSIWCYELVAQTTSDEEDQEESNGN